MLAFFYSVFENILLVVSLSTDAFAACFSYGADNIKIPRGPLFVISGICSGMLGVSLLAGSVVSVFLPAGLTRWLCFVLLLCIGIFRLFDNLLKGYIRRHNRLRLRFSAFDLNFILTVYADAESADADGSKSISLKEAAALAAALSLDGLAVGFGAAVSGGNIFMPMLLSLVFTLVAVKGGCALGAQLRRALPFDLSYLSALLLVALAFLRL